MGKPGMRRWLIAGGALLCVALLVVVAVVNLNSLLQRNRAYLLSQAEEVLGRSVRAGEIELSVWGGLGLRVEDFAVADDRAYSAGDFVRARAAEVRLRLIPLLRKEFEIRSVLLREPVITVIRSESGTYNFSSLGKEEQEKGGEGERPRRDRDGPAALSIALANISNGELIYRDRQAKSEFTIKHIDFTLRDAGRDKPVSFTFEAAVFTETSNVSVGGRAGPFGGGDWRQIPVDAEITVDALDLTRLQEAIPHVKEFLPGIMLGGVVSLKSLKLKGRAGNLAFDGNLDAGAAAVILGNWFNKPAGIPFHVAAEGEFADRVLSLRAAELRLHGIDARAKGNLEVAEPPRLDLSLTFRQAALDGLDEIFPALAGLGLGGNVKGQAAVRGRIGAGAVPQVQGEITVAQGRATFAQLTLPLTDVGGTVSFDGSAASVRNGSATLGRSRIAWSADVRRFSPLALTYKAAAPELFAADLRSAGSEERRTDVLKNFTSEGDVSLAGGRAALRGKFLSAEGVLNGVSFQRLEAMAALGGDTLNVRNFSVNALGGTIAGEGEYAFGGAVPRFSLNSRLQRIDVNEAYRLLSAEPEQEVRGRLSVDFTASGSGTRWNDIRPSLQARGDAQVVDGAVLDINLVDSALSGVTGLPQARNIISPELRRKYPDTFEAKDTKFKDMKGRFELARERINLRELRLAATDYTIEGEGTIGFDRRVDLRSVLLLSTRLSADLARSWREIKFLFNDRNEFQMPFTISGKSPNLRTRPDSGYLARVLQRGLLGEGAERLERQLFGRKERRRAQEEESAPQQPDKRKSRPAEDLIRRGLEELFKR